MAANQLPSDSRWASIVAVNPRSEEVRSWIVHNVDAWPETIHALTNVLLEFEKSNSNAAILPSRPAEPTPGSVV